MLYLTLFLLTLIFVAAFFLCSKELFAPPVVVSLAMVFATICTCINEKKWGLEFSINTTWVLVLGVGSFVIGGVLAILLSNIGTKRLLKLEHKKSEPTYIEIKDWKTIVIIVFQIATVIFAYIELRNMTGGKSWNEIVSIYREVTTTVNPVLNTMRFSTLCGLALKASFAFSMIYVYVVANNIAINPKKSVLRLIINCVPVLLGVIQSFMQGYRGEMIRYWIALLVVLFVVKKQINGWKPNKETKKLILVMACSFVAIGVFFVIFRGTVGRAEDWNPIYYVTFYAGSPVAALDLFIKDPLPPSSIWGKETFYDMIQSIGAWFNKPELRYLFYKEFRKSPNGTYIGNVYTGLRHSYYDFGLWGMALVMLLLGLFFTFFYVKIRDKRGNNPIDFRLLIYSYISFTFFMYFYSCYNNFICFGFIRLMMELFLARWFLVGWKFDPNILRFRVGKKPKENE